MEPVILLLPTFSLPSCSKSPTDPGNVPTILLLTKFRMVMCPPIQATERVPSLAAQEHGSSRLLLQ
jgi:hypothetical protein